MIKAVIFDMYETLITHYNCPLYFSEEMAKDAGVPIEKFQPVWRSTEHERSVGTVTVDEVVKNILVENQCYSEEKLDTIMRKRIATKKECFRHLHPDIIPMLNALKEQGIKIGLISNCFSEEAKVIRESILFPYFDAVYLSYEQGMEKPDERIFRKCMEELDVVPGECLYVGDGGSRELEAARQLGMNAVQAVWYLQEKTVNVIKRKPDFYQLESPLHVVKMSERPLKGRKMSKSWKKKYEEKQKNRVEEPLPRMDLGEGYYIEYKEVSNHLGGYHKVGMKLYDENDQLIKEITDKQGYFLDFPGVVGGTWCDKLVGDYAEGVEFACYVSKFRHGFALFNWLVQPDGRYWADEDGFGAERDEEIRLYAYMNQRGEFVTPFADFKPNRELESLEAFKARTDKFIWNSLPVKKGKTEFCGNDFSYEPEPELWVNESVKDKVDIYGNMRSFHGNTVVFPLKKEDMARIEQIQQELEQIREDYKDMQWEAYLAETVEENTYHITLHDLVNCKDLEPIKAQMEQTEKHALYIVEQLRKMNFPSIKMEPVSMFNMNGTSMVLGFHAASEADHDNLMMLHELFQSVVQLSYPLTPHVTLSYFRYGKHKAGKLEKLHEIVNKVNQMIREKKEQGEPWIVELDVKNLAYQRFESMNCYKTIEG